MRVALLPLPAAGVAAFINDVVDPALTAPCSLIVVWATKVITALNPMLAVCPLTEGWKV
jgi:hypothetical protein